MKFVLILTMFGMDAPDYWYVVDSNLSGYECVQLLEKHQAYLEKTFHYTDFNLTCEVDNANYP